MKKSLVSVAVALALTGLACGTALAQGWYNDDYLNSTGATATSLDLTFTGDLTSALAGGGFVAAFPYPGGTVLTGTIPQTSPVDGLTVTDSYDPGTNTTTLVYQGTAGCASGLTAHVGYSILGGYTGEENTQSPAFLGSSWDNSEGTLLPADVALTVTDQGAGSASGSGGTTYMVLVASVGSASGGGATTTEWAEFAVPSNALGAPFFENDGTAPVTLSNVGYQLSPTQIPLDDLNSTDEPASNFTPFVGIPDGTTLQPGEAVTPEPSTLVLLGAAALGLLGSCRRRRGLAA